MDRNRLGRDVVVDAWRIGRERGLMRLGEGSKDDEAKEQGKRRLIAKVFTP